MRIEVPSVYCYPLSLRPNPFVGDRSGTASEVAGSCGLSIEHSDENGKPIPDALRLRIGAGFVVRDGDCGGGRSDRRLDRLKRGKGASRCVTGRMATSIRDNSVRASVTRSELSISRARARRSRLERAIARKHGCHAPIRLTAGLGHGGRDGAACIRRTGQRGDSTTPSSTTM